MTQVTHVLIPCGATLETACPACAKRAQSLRAEQRRDGWHLEHEPDHAVPRTDDDQEYWLTLRGRVGPVGLPSCLGPGLYQMWWQPSWAQWTPR